MLIKYLITCKKDCFIFTESFKKKIPKNRVRTHYYNFFIIIIVQRMAMVSEVKYIHRQICTYHKGKKKFGLARFGVIHKSRACGTHPLVGCNITTHESPEPSYFYVASSRITIHPPGLYRLLAKLLQRPHAIYIFSIHICFLFYYNLFTNRLLKKKI